MDWNRVEGNWKQVKGKVKEQWGSSPTMTWTRSPAARAARRKDPGGYGIEKDRVRRDIDDWYGRQTWNW